MIDFVVSFVEWILDNPIDGMLLFLCVYIVGTTLMLPASVFAMATAFLCCHLLGPAAGFFMGVLLVFFASSIGAFLAFLLARYLLKDTVKKCIVGPKCVKVSALYQVIEENGLKVVFLCRLSPILPYNLLNYTLGASQVKTKHYLIGGLGMLPMICLYTYIAMSVQDIADGLNNGSNGQWYWYVMGAGAVILIATVIYITCLAKKKLSEMLNGVKEKNETVSLGCKSNMNQQGWSIQGNRIPSLLVPLSCSGDSRIFSLQLTGDGMKAHES